MARVKNARGGLGDEDPRRPPCLPVDLKGKATKKLAMRKHKNLDADTAIAAVVAEAIEHAERGGAQSGVLLQISFLHQRGLHLSRLSAIMVV